jgi:hypothetical protein
MSSFSQVIESQSISLAQYEETKKTVGVWVSAFNGCPVNKCALERVIRQMTPKGTGWSVYFEAAK